YARRAPTIGQIGSSAEPYARRRVHRPRQGAGGGRMSATRPGRWRRIRALIMFLFGFGISFDATRVKVGLVIEEPTPETTWFLASLANTPFFDVRESSDRRA